VASTLSSVGEKRKNDLKNNDASKKGKAAVSTKKGAASSFRKKK
jgi:hypothetical protein